MSRRPAYEHAVGIAESVVHTDGVIQLFFAFRGQPVECRNVQAVANKEVVWQRNSWAIDHGLNTGIEPKAERVIGYYVVANNIDARQRISAAVHRSIRTPRRC